MEAERVDEPMQLQGREAVAEWISSGKAMQAFCDETGQSYWALRRWRLKFGDELGIAIRRRPGALKSNTLRSSAMARSRCVSIEVNAAVAMKPVSTVEIRLRGERTMVVDTDIDSTALSRLVVAIERAA